MNFQEKIEIYKDIIVSLDYCINDYLYILDVENDEYFISPHAAVRFKMDNAYFKNPVKEFKKIIYYKDSEAQCETSLLSFHKSQIYVVLTSFWKQTGFLLSPDYYLPY